MIRMILADGRTLGFQPYRLHSEDLFEFLSERVRAANPDSVMIDRTPNPR